MALIPFLEEQELSEKSQQFIQGLKQQFGTVPPMFKLLSRNEDLLESYINMNEATFNNGSLPILLKYMIFLSVASALNCQYCTTQMSMACRYSGIEETTIQNIIENNENISPERTRAVLQFAVKSTLDGINVSEEDLQPLRNFNITDEEILEISGVVAITIYSVNLADIFKLAQHINLNG